VERFENGEISQSCSQITSKLVTSSYTALVHGFIFNLALITTLLKNEVITSRAQDFLKLLSDFLSPTSYHAVSRLKLDKQDFKFVQMFM